MFSKAMQDCLQEHKVVAGELHTKNVVKAIAKGKKLLAIRRKAGSNWRAVLQHIPMQKEEIRNCMLLAVEKINPKHYRFGVSKLMVYRDMGYDLSRNVIKSAIH